MNLLKYFLSLTLILGPYAQAWDQATSKVVQVDQASGVSSTPNYWKTGDAEVLLTGVAAYNDGASAKPVDCTGGSSTMTGVRNATNPMYDKFSWLVSKPAGNMQGQGVAFEFDVDNGVAGVQGMDLLFDYMLASGTFTAGDKDTNSDLMIYLYDVTAGQLIEPKGGSKLLTSSTTVTGSYRGWFQSTLGSKKYRVCLHQATTSASSYGMIVDAGKVQKSKHVVGTIITDWQTYTPAISHDSGGVTNVTHFAKWRQVGENIEVSVTSRFSNTSGAFVGWRIGLPAGLSIDTSKLPITDSLANNIGSAHAYDNGIDLYGGVVSLRSATLVEVRFNQTKTGTNPVPVTTSVGNIAPFAFNNLDTISASFSAPIVGWSAGARMSDGYDGRVISAYAARSSGQTGVNPNNSQVKIQLNALGQPNLDTVAGWDFVNNRYVFKSSGSYTINAGIEVANINTILSGFYIARLVVNGSTTYNISVYQAAIAAQGFTLSGSQKLNVKAGDYVELYLFSSGNHSTNTLTVNASNATSMSITKDSGTPFMSPTALWETHYAGTAGDAIGTTDSLIKFTTKVEDTFGSYNPATGLWTAKGPATCSFSSRVGTASVNIALGQNFFATLYKNGNIYRVGNASNGTGAAATHQSIVTLVSEKVSTGDTYAIYARSSVATTSGTADSTIYFTVSCRQSGN